MIENEMAALFYEWNSALQTGNPKHVVVLYESDAILLPTIFNKVRHNRGKREYYFTDFLALGPAGKVDESNVRIFDQIAINSGVCTFTFKDGCIV